jgi:hypothetical protein
LVPELLKDPNPDAQIMVRDAIAVGLEDAKGLVDRDGRARGIAQGAYAPWIQRLGISSYGSLEAMKQQRKEWYVPHPLEPALRAAVAERLAQGKIDPALTMQWINTQVPSLGDDAFLRAVWRPRVVQEGCDDPRADRHV